MNKNEILYAISVLTNLLGLEACKGELKTETETKLKELIKSL